MIVVLLLLFQSICLYCQHLVLFVHDKWINPKNVRLLKEAAETSPAQPGKLVLSSNKASQSRQRYRKRAEHGANSCRFCANSPLGYCRHHFHLQERQLQQEQELQTGRFWSNIAVAGDKSLEQRQKRRLHRELKKNLKNRLSVQNTTQQHNINSIPCKNSYCIQSSFQLFKNQIDDDDTGYQTASTTTTKPSSSSLNLLRNDSLSNYHSSSSSSTSEGSCTSKRDRVTESATITEEAALKEAETRRAAVSSSFASAESLGSPTSLCGTPQINAIA